MVSHTNPAAARRVATTDKLPASSGVSDAQPISSFASARVSSRTAPAVAADAMCRSVAEQFVDRRFRARLGVDALDDHRARERVRTIGGGKAARNHYGTRRYASIRHLLRGPIVDLGARADEHAHRDHRVLL